MATEDVFTAQRAKPFYLVIIRMITMIALAITTCFTLGLTGISGNFPPLDMLYFPFVNIICAVVILRTFRQRRTSVWRYLGFEKTRLGKDIAWGFLWLIVTYIPLFVVLMGSMYLMFGSDMFQHFERVFAKSSPQLPAGVLAVMSVLGAVVFLVNAPIEEIVYRGWLQDGLAERHAFGLQHTMFAADGRGMIIHGFAFFAWGVTAGVIVHKQQRLAPMVIAHWIVNIALGVGPMLVLGFTGV